MDELQKMADHSFGDMVKGVVDVDVPLKTIGAEALKTLKFKAK